MSSSDTTMRNAYSPTTPNNHPVDAFWATAKLPQDFRGEISVTLVVDDNGMRVVFPDAPNANARPAMR